LEAPDVGRPQAAEGDVVAVLPVHADDAGVFSVPAAVFAGDLRGGRLALARPRDDAAGVVAVSPILSLASLSVFLTVITRLSAGQVCVAKLGGTEL
jgi:hypothetical protein